MRKKGEKFKFPEEFFFRPLHATFHPFHNKNKKITINIKNKKMIRNIIILVRGQHPRSHSVIIILLFIISERECPWLCWTRTVLLYNKAPANNVDYSNRLTNFFDGPLSFLFAGWTWSIRPLLVVSTVDVIRLFRSLFFSFILYSSGGTSRWFKGANTLLMSRDSIYYYLFIFYVQTMLLGFVEGGKIERKCKDTPSDESERLAGPVQFRLTT